VTDLEDRTWHLTVETWRGISIGAVHYYGRIHQPQPDSLTYPLSKDGQRLYGSITVEAPLTVEQAEALSKHDHWHWEPGDVTARFDTREEVIARAIETWRPIARARGGGRLVLGHAAFLNEAKPVLAEEPEPDVAR
jgi:hypothetical protein